MLIQIIFHHFCGLSSKRRLTTNQADTNSLKYLSMQAIKHHHIITKIIL